MNFFFKFIFQLLRFITKYEPGASINARARSVEIVSTTVYWLNTRETEIEQAFNPRGLKLAPPSAYKKLNNSTPEEFKLKFQEHIANSKEFKQFKNELFSNKKSF